MQRTKSRYRTSIFIFGVAGLPLVILTAGSAWTILFTLLSMYYPAEYRITLLVLLLAALFLSFFSVVLIRSARFKFNTLEFTGNTLTVTGWLGLGTRRVYMLSELTGFTRTFEPTNVASGLTLNLYDEHVRIAEITDSVYRNFPYLYRQVVTQCTDLGEEEFSFPRLVKNMMGVRLRWEAGNAQITPEPNRKT